MSVIAAFAIGLIFGFGLIVSGMSNPAKVLGFLDLSGAWDPSLAFVMAGAIAIGAFAFALARRRTATLLGAPLSLPVIGAIDGRLLAGSALFGIGWGLAGICPGPALTLLGAGVAGGVIFVAAMFAGIALFELYRRRAG